MRERKLRGAGAMSDHILPPPNGVDAALGVGFVATLLGYLPTATAVVIFVYYMLQIAVAIRTLMTKRRLAKGQMRRASDACA